MTELETVLAELGMSHYLNDFIEQGFDSWDAILDIAESDFDALLVKLGHRRKLQRKIASWMGLPSNQVLPSQARNAPNGGQGAEEQRAGAAKADGEIVTNIQPQRAKRKYTRQDRDAPRRSRSAYVIFSQRMRSELECRNLSLSEDAD
jgi:hypothetical protein